VIFAKNRIEKGHFQPKNTDLDTKFFQNFTRSDTFFLGRTQVLKMGKTLVLKK